MKETAVFLDSYVIQQDMRIRLPKSILLNMDIEKGKTVFDIFYDNSEKEIILRIHETDKTTKNMEE